MMCFKVQFNIFLVLKAKFLFFDETSEFSEFLSFDLQPGMIAKKNRTNSLFIEDVRCSGQVG